jgi:hypothetical protein
VRLDGTTSVAATEIRTRGIEFHQDQERGGDVPTVCTFSPAASQVAVAPQPTVTDARIHLWLPQHEPVGDAALRLTIYLVIR